MDLKVMFIAEYLSEKHSFSQLCQDYQISRKTGYKWVERYELEGPSGLDERSRRRHNQTYVVPLVVRQAIIELRSTGETVPGPKKIQNDLMKRFPGQDPPSKTTIYNILKAADLICFDRYASVLLSTPSLCVRQKRLISSSAQITKANFSPGRAFGAIH
jgi:transposase-like protein|nr:helix-turn-helix domain-containing protein [Pseudomonas brassicacearum]